MHRQGRDEVLGTAYSDHDLVVFLEGAGIADPETILADPQWVEWRGGPAHESAPPDAEPVPEPRSGWSGRGWRGPYEGSPFRCVGRGYVGPHIAFSLSDAVAH